MTTLTTVTDAMTERAQSIVPMSMQIRGAHLYDRARRFVTRTNGQKIFVEKPIPPVEEVALVDIDLSNPFLYRQGKWQSYFERVRNEAPVPSGRSPATLTSSRSTRTMRRSRLSRSSSSASRRGSWMSPCSSPWTRPSTTGSAPPSRASWLRRTCARWRA